MPDLRMELGEEQLWPSSTVRTAAKSRRSNRDATPINPIPQTIPPIMFITSFIMG
jgi:hypothetical protein